MPYNKENPANTEKIRNLGAVLRPNFKALEEGSETDPDSQKLKYWSLNLYSRDDIPSAPGSDAAQVTDAFVLFSKDGADSNKPELFGRYESGEIVQISNFPPNIAPATFPNNGETFLSGGLLMKYALSDQLGSSSTVTLTWAGTGANELGLTSFPNECFNVQVTPFSSNSGSNVPRITAVTKDDFTFVTSNITNGQYFITAIGR